MWCTAIVPAFLFFASAYTQECVVRSSSSKRILKFAQSTVETASGLARSRVDAAKTPTRWRFAPSALVQHQTVNASSVHWFLECLIK